MVSRYCLKIVWYFVSTQEYVLLIVPSQHTSDRNLIFFPLLHKKLCRQLLTSFRHFAFSFFCFTKYIVFISRKNFQKYFQDFQNCVKGYMYIHFKLQQITRLPNQYFSLKIIYITYLSNSHSLQKNITKYIKCKRKKSS